MGRNDSRHPVFLFGVVVCVCVCVFFFLLFFCVCVFFGGGENHPAELRELFYPEREGKKHAPPLVFCFSGVSLTGLLLGPVGGGGEFEGESLPKKAGGK